LRFCGGLEWFRESWAFANRLWSWKSSVTDNTGYSMAIVWIELIFRLRFRVFVRDRRASSAALHHPPSRNAVLQDHPRCCDPWPRLQLFVAHNRYHSIGRNHALGRALAVWQRRTHNALYNLSSAALETAYTYNVLARTLTVFLLFLHSSAASTMSSRKIWWVSTTRRSQ
jgi:hypothetical protein